jgi:hypothetical protein
LDAKSMLKAPPPPQFRTKKGTGAVVLTGVDGRSLMARRFREISAAMAADLGNDLTEAQRHLIARAATLICWSEEREAELARGEEFDVALYSTVTNTLRRLLDTLGIERRPRDVTPSLHDYLARRAEQ